MGVRIIKVKDYQHRQWMIIAFFLCIAILGLAYIVYDDYQHTSIVRLPENPNQLESIINDWKDEKFIISFNSTSSVVVVDEEMWNERSRGAKMDMVTQFARYCARKNKTSQWTLSVLNQNHKRVLAEINKSTYRID